jgi:Ca2+-binding RTX toxin-like protein
MCRVFDTDGTPVGVPVNLTEGQTGAQFAPDVTGLIDGRFMVTWSAEGDRGDVIGRIYDPRTEAVSWTGGTIGERFYGTDIAGGTGDSLNGAGGNDRIFAQKGDDSVTGGSGNDRLDGGAGADRLRGDSGNDRLLGGSGNDLLRGGSGLDTITGGTGRDSFVFDTAPGARHADRIADFKAADDTIRIDDAVFANLGTGTLAKAAFARNTSGQATDRSDRIIYETDTGKLYFDRDGTGSAARVHVATLDKNLALTHADFLVF